MFGSIIHLLFQPFLIRHHQGQGVSWMFHLSVDAVTWVVGQLNAGITFIHLLQI